MRTLICGCGYIGLALGAELARQGHEVFGLRRSADSANALKQAGITPLIADITAPEQLSSLPFPFDWVVNTTASSHGAEDDYRKIYLQGNKNLIQAISKPRTNFIAGGASVLASRSSTFLEGEVFCPAPLSEWPIKKFVYTSSTSVYGQNDGSKVFEESPTNPASPLAQILVESEKQILEAAQNHHFPAVILRVAGIYGPQRGFYLSQFLKGQATISGNPERFLNMIHRDDVVGAIIVALEKGQPGQIYNAVDEEPIPQIQLFRWLSDFLHQPMPPLATEAETRKRDATNKQVSNQKLKTHLAYPFKFPTFRQGFTAELQSSENGPAAVPPTH